MERRLGKDGARGVNRLDLDSVDPGSVARFWVHIVNNKLGEPIRLPIIVARGKRPGPVLGLTAAVHGNELNGIPVLQQLFADIEVEELAGTIIGVLVVNVPGLVLERREFNDGSDLNRIAPGKQGGNTSQVYIHRFIDRVLSQFNYHVDLHTASFGRLNSHYVRADMDDERTARMARLQGSQIIVHNAANDTTLRGAAAAIDIPSITVELRDPHIFQQGVIKNSLTGIYNVLHDLQMLENGSGSYPVEKTILCSRSFWMHTDEGGILTVLPKIAQRVSEGETIAEVRTIFGELRRTYESPVDGIVVGRSVNPLNQTGSRMVHLGVKPRAIECVTDEPGDTLADMMRREIR